MRDMKIAIDRLRHQQVIVMDDGKEYIWKCLEPIAERRVGESKKMIIRGKKVPKNNVVRLWVNEVGRFDYFKGKSKSYVHVFSIL